MIPAREVPGSDAGASTPGLPRFPQPYTKRILSRAILLWFIVRLVVLALTVFGNAQAPRDVLYLLLDSPVIAGSARIAALTTATVVALAAVDLYATREHILIANLGIPTVRALTLVAIVALVPEIVILVVRAI